MAEPQIATTWVGGVVATLWAALLGVIGLLYHKNEKKFEVLFEWRDQANKDFIRQDRCDARHVDLRDILREIRDEQKHQRGLLERHTGINGDKGGGP